MPQILATRQSIFSHFPTIAYNVVGIAASSGGIKAISNLISTLPSDFPAAIVVVQHLSDHFPSFLPEVYRRYTSLRVEQAGHAELLRPGTIYTSVPGKHLLVKLDGRFFLSNEPKVNFVRPAADKLFRSLAMSYKARAIAVVLTGRGEDGALGAVTIKKYGGTVIAQDEATSKCFKMPKATIDTGKVDWVLPLDAIATTLVKLTMTEKVA